MSVVRTATVLRLEDGRRLAFAEVGDPRGEPVFGFHGTPGSSEQLGMVAEAAERVGVRCILPDRPGYGLSDFQADRIPGAKLHECPGEAHLLFVPHAEEILRAAAGRG